MKQDRAIDRRVVKPARRSQVRSVRGTTVIEIVGRVLIAFFAVLATSGTGSGNTIGGVLALTAIWVTCIQVGFASNAPELLALGSATPATRGVLLGIVSTSAWEFWRGDSTSEASRLILCGLLILLLSMGWGALIRRITARRRILIVGTSNAGKEIGRELESMARPQFELIGFVSEGGMTDPYLTAPVVGTVGALQEVVQQLRPDIIVVAVERNRPAIFGPLLASAEAGFKVVEAAQFCEHAFGRVPVRDIQRVWFMSVLHLYQRQYSRLAKRAFDIIVASFGLLLALPILPILWILVRLSAGPVILRQVRIGAFGEPFTMYKFRTMHADAEKSGQAVWAKDDDPRVTAPGRIMRRLRLDEIPQLWNVLRGNMSIVGPRPERPELMQYLEQHVPFWTHRLLVKPGLTGWAQVRRGYAADAEGSIDKLSYDLWYLRHRSIVVDIAICLKTFGVMVTGAPETQAPRPAAAATAVPATEAAGSAGDTHAIPITHR